VVPAERAELQKWMTRLADGDRSAFHPVFSLAHPLLLRFAERMLRGAPEAEDAAQQALLKVFAHAAQFEPERDALSWMFGLTAWECRTARQARHRRRERDEVPEGVAAETPESMLTTNQLLEAARELVGALSREDVETLAAAWGNAPRPPIPAATFRKRLQRTVGRLRLAWRFKHGAD
jgi:DNA-directed RNA polymerase specialized sigma24 family protein